jgi:hypothetical protein
MTPRLEARPKFKGLPIPYTVPVVDGVPDFKGVDPTRWGKAAKTNLCHLCGQPNDSTLAWLGGPGCEVSRIFQDGPMHEACAREAIRLCPFVSARKDYSAKTKAAKPGMFEGPAVRPEKMRLMFSTGYDLVRLPDRIALRSHPFVHAENVRPPRCPS